jgi:hypothetical protein
MSVEKSDSGLRKMRNDMVFNAKQLGTQLLVFLNLQKVESSQVVELMSRMAAGVGVLEYVVVVV